MSSNVWVIAGAGMICGARVAMPASEADNSVFKDGDRLWIDVCILGQHIPQMYRRDELHELTFHTAAKMGLCPRCLGFGTRQTFPDLYPRNMTDIGEPCEDCGGTGHPYIRVIIRETETSISGEITILPHPYLPSETGEHCLSCGEREGHKQHAREGAK